MTADNRAYFQQRAEEELQLAQAAGHANAVRAHYILAGHYLDLVHNEEAQAALAAEGETGPSGGLDEWAMRFAGRTSSEHGALAPDHVAARIHACRTADDRAGVRLWEQVLSQIERDPIGKALPAG